MEPVLLLLLLQNYRNSIPPILIMKFFSTRYNSTRSSITLFAICVSDEQIPNFFKCHTEFHLNTVFQS